MIDSEVLSSDDDDFEDEYLENLARMAVKGSAEQGISMTAKLLEDEDSDGVSGFTLKLGIEGRNIFVINSNSKNSMRFRLRLYHAKY